MDKYATGILLILENSAHLPKWSHIKIPWKSILNVMLKISLQWLKRKLFHKDR